MSLFDIFSGSSGRRAAMATTNAINNQTGLATNAIQTGLNNALPMYQEGRNALTTEYGHALDSLRGQYPQTQGYLQQGIDAYSPMVQQGGRGLSAYMDIAGANGPEGSARGLEALRSSPGYQFARDEGEQGVLRSASARGSLGGGNTQVDLARYLTGFADQTAGSYASRLQPLLQMYGQGVAGQAAGYGAQANASANQGNALANTATGLGNALSGNFAQAGGAYSQAGNNTASILAGSTQPLANAVNGGMMAGQQGSANTWGALFGAANLAAQLYGGGGASGGSTGLARFPGGSSALGFSGFGG